MALRVPLVVLAVLALAPLAAASEPDAEVEAALARAEETLASIEILLPASSGSSEPHEAHEAPREPSSRDEGPPPRDGTRTTDLLAPAAPLVERVEWAVDPALSQVPADFDVDWILNPRTPDAAPAPVAAPAPARDEAAPAATSAAEPAPALAPVVLAAGVAAAGGASTLSLAWDRLRRLGWLAVLYTRIAKERLLDHGGRERLLEQVRLQPGAPLADLARAADIPRNTAVYHLRRLEKEGLVSSTKQGRVRLYFLAGGPVRRESAGALAALRHPVARALATEIGNAPGLDQRALCEKVGLAPSLAHWHATRLEDAGIVQRQREGRHVRYYPGASFHVLRG